MSDTVSCGNSHTKPPVAQPDRESRRSAALLTGHAEASKPLERVPQESGAAQYGIDMSRIVFWITVGVGGTLLVVFMKYLLPLVRGAVSGLGLFSRIALASALGMALFGLFYYPAVRYLSTRVRYSRRIPSVDSPRLARTAAYGLGVCAPVAVFFVLSALRTNLWLATVGLVVGYLIVVASGVRLSVLLDRTMRKYPEDHLLELLKRGEPYDRERIVRLVHTLAVEWDGDIRRIRLRRLRTLIQYIEGHNLDPQALERRSLGESLIADLKRRTEAALLERDMVEAGFEQDRWSYKRERLERRRSGAGSTLVEDLEDALKDAAGDAPLGERKPEGRDFNEIGDVPD